MYNIKNTKAPIAGLMHCFYSAESVVVATASFFMPTVLST